jgi:hypothetical protein
MQRLRTMAALFVVAACAALPAAARTDALAAVDACRMQLETDVDVGFRRIAARCPELARAIRASDWAAWLPAGWDDADNQLSAGSLAVLHTLVVRERALPLRAHAADVARLRLILAELAARNEESHGWWARLQNWLRRVLARAAPEADKSGFDRLLGRVQLSQAVLEFVTYGTFAFVLLLAGYIILNEWRVAHGRRRPARTKSGSMPTGAEPAQALNWQDIEGAALHERPRMLLALIAAQLTAARRLPVAAALTVRELVRAAQLPDAADRERLVEVALAVERLRFSDQAVAPASLAAVMQRGRELLERLNAASQAIA